MSKTPVTEMKRSSNALKINHINWEDVPVLIACAEHKSFRKAAAHLQMSTPTVMRRIDRLEEALGQCIFIRINEGVSLTTRGKSILAYAKKMEDGFFDLLRDNSLSNEQAMKGDVSISITEGLGTCWFIPRMIEFQKTYPEVKINLNCSMTKVDVFRLESDIALQFNKPDSPDLIAAKIANMHIYPFASQNYLDIYGTPESNKDLARHRMVQQLSDQIPRNAFFEAFGNHINVAVETNTSTANYYAIAQGAGIGAIPTYVYPEWGNIVPVDKIAKPACLEIWMTYHPEVKKVPCKALAIEWIKEIFDPKVYPCFRREFIHPLDLVKMKPEDSHADYIEKVAV